MIQLRLFFISLFVSIAAAAQGYQFTTLADIEATEIKSQDHTGTCWSFSTISFLESEIIRLKGKRIDLSEMYQVRNTYSKKAWNYVMRQGKTQFGEGALAHDVINSFREYGLAPQTAYTGLQPGETVYNHAEMVAVLESMLKTYVSNPGKSLSPQWKPAIESVLDAYLGEKPAQFNYEGVSYTPQSFLKMTGIRADDYITLTSFLHQPFYASFILNIPDNFSNGNFYNVPLDDFISILNTALQNGYTIAWDADVSEKTFSAKNGIAFIPETDSGKAEGLTKPVPEKKITPEYRQQEFENYTTTDDHLMHITGMMKDQNGTVYYKVKNSWGTNPDHIGNNGYVRVSEAYLRLKTISILLHKDALPKEWKRKLGL